MKTMRKLFTVLLALAMTLALAVPAFAADTGSITITNPQGDHTYTAYKIFDVTYSGDNYSYTISGTDAAFNTVKAYADEAANGLKLTAVANTNKYSIADAVGDAGILLIHICQSDGISIVVNADEHHAAVRICESDHFFINYLSKLSLEFYIFGFKVHGDASSYEF